MKGVRLPHDSPTRKFWQDPALVQCPRCDTLSFLVYGDNPLDHYHLQCAKCGWSLCSVEKCSQVSPAVAVAAIAAARVANPPNIAIANQTPADGSSSITRAFVDLVSRMRSAQRRFFSGRTSTNLAEARDLERRVDHILKTANGITPEGLFDAPPIDPRFEGGDN